METNDERDKRICEENIKSLDRKGSYFQSEDVELVMQQCGCTEDKAIKVLTLTRGDLARAILLINKDGI